MKVDISQVDDYILGTSWPLESTLIVIQARMGSTRLPGKVLLPLGSGGDTVLGILLKRLSSYFRPFQVPIIVATTNNQEDDVIVQTGEAHPGIAIFRGSQDDVLDRYYRTCDAFRGHYCVRVTSDCPFVDPHLIHLGCQQADDATYVSNTQKRTLPKGFDFEIFSSRMLREAALHATTPFEREHVTPYLYRGDRYRIENIEFAFAREHGLSEWRVTLDTKEDYRFLQQLAAAIEQKFSMRKEPLVEVSAYEIVQILIAKQNEFQYA